MLYRYELSVDGKKQDIGFLMGLSGIDNPKTKKLIQNFDKHLPFPPIKQNTDTKSFFTEEGIRFFKTDINRIIKFYHNHGLYDIDIITLDEKNLRDENVIYKDKFQTIIKNYL